MSRLRFATGYLSFVAFENRNGVPVQCSVGFAVALSFCLFLFGISGREATVSPFVRGIDRKGGGYRLVGCYRRFYDCSEYDLIYVCLSEYERALGLSFLFRKNGNALSLSGVFPFRTSSFRYGSEKEKKQKNVSECGLEITGGK